MKKLDVPQSGSQASTTASRNRFGQYDRTRAIPINPNSTRQSLARSRLSELSVAWRALSSAERIAWNEYGASHPRTDSLGQTVYPTGHQSFVGVNSALVNAGLPQTTVPPVDVDLPAPELTLTINDTPTFTVAFAPTPLDNGSKMVVEASPMVSAGRTFNGDYRFIQASAADAASPVNVAAAYTAKFGALAAGLRVFVRAYVILPSGQRTVGVVQTAIIG
jgi:hypothetical protein